MSDGFCLGHPNAHLWGMYWNVGVPPACAFLHRDKTRDHFRSLSHSGELPATFRPTVAYVSSSGPERYIGETGSAFPAVSAAERQIQSSKGNAILKQNRSKTLPKSSTSAPKSSKGNAILKKSAPKRSQEARRVLAKAPKGAQKALKKLSKALKKLQRERNP